MIAYLFKVDSLFAPRRYTSCANAVLLRKHMQYYCVSTCSTTALKSQYTQFALNCRCDTNAP